MSADNAQTEVRSLWHPYANRILAKCLLPSHHNPREAVKDPLAIKNRQLENNMIHEWLYIVAIIESGKNVLVISH